ncbi:hypothetical protein AcV5_007742 [Taiwanofungus camphoratus]|nr:hypothetical protein AcV5_007742 [Antrodia cinnamomea]
MPYLETFAPVWRSSRHLLTYKWYISMLLVCIKTHSGHQVTTCSHALLDDEARSLYAHGSSPIRMSSSRSLLDIFHNIRKLVLNFAKASETADKYCQVIFVVVQSSVHSSVHFASCLMASACDSDREASHMFFASAISHFIPL